MRCTALLLAMAFSGSIFAQIPGPEVPSGQGVNIHFTTARPGEMEMLAQGGFGFVRMDFAWNSTERQPGVYDFGAYDRLIADLSGHNIRALFILDYSNPLYDSGLSPHTPEGRAAFARWAAAATKHFAGKGILWEMWNEPNIAQFWKPKPNPEDYSKLAIEVGRAIREAAPGETYIGPATSTIDLPFLEACFKAGVLEYFSAVSVHPYRQTAPETVTDEYRKLRLLVDRYAPAGKRIPIISGEWGFSDIAPAMGLDNQGKYLARQWLTNLSCDVPLSIWYDWHDDGTNSTDWECHFGTVAHAYHEGGNPVYDPKPAYRAAQALTSALRGYRFDKRLALDSPDDWLLLFTKGNEAKLVAWSTASVPHKAMLPVSAGRFSVTSHIGESQEPITADANGLSIQLSDGPVYLAPEQPNEFLQILANWTRLQTDKPLVAPLTFTPDLQVKNTTGRPLRLFTWADNAMEIAPGTSRGTGNTYSLLRTAHPIRMRQQLHIEGFPKAYQESVVTVSNPISVTPLPAMGGKLPVQIETSTGEPVSGKLEVSSPTRTQLEVITRKGDTEQIVSMPAGPTSQRYTFAAKLTGEQGASLTDVPARTHQVIPLDPAQYHLIGDGNPQVSSQQTMKEVTAPEGLPAAGAKSLQIDYQFSPGWKFIRLAVTAPEMQKIEGKPLALGMWIYGDGSGNSPRMRFVDATGQCFQPTAPELHYKGWRYVEFPMDSGNVGRWGGANDGIIHYPIRLDTLFLLDSPTQFGTAGTIHITHPVLVYAPS